MESKPQSVRSKREMYRRLLAGEFGNFSPHHDSVERWRRDKRLYKAHRLWGVRSMDAGDRRQRLDVPREMVAAACRQFKGGYQISPMIDEHLTLRAHVFDCDARGLVLEYVEGFRTVKWRDAFAKYQKVATGIAARMLLRRHLWSADCENLWRLLEDYPGHVVELTACERAVGALPNSNVVIWEVRCGSGRYEADAFYR